MSDIPVNCESLQPRPPTHVLTGFATQLWSCGGRDFDPDGRAAFADPDAVAATGAFIQALREAGPVDWPNQGRDVGEALRAAAADAERRFAATG